MYAPNITPDKQNGIESYSLDDFARAVRNGIRKDGTTLYPSMPYPSFALLSDDDIIALYAYFSHGIKADSTPRKPNEIQWTLSIRWPVSIWRKLYAPDGVAFDASPYNDEITTRGAYIVQGLGHCGICHTSRAITFQKKDYDETNPHYLSGNRLIDGWVTVNLRNVDDGMKN